MRTRYFFYTSILVTLVSCSIPGYSFGQGEANIWYFGLQAGLDFTGGAPVALTNSGMSITEGGVSISDAAGNLLFYSNGVTIKNKNHVTMANGTGLMGDPSSSQSAVTFLKPGSTTIYYLFTADYEANPNGIRYSEIDMTLNGGLGGVTAVKNVLLNTPSCEKLIAIRHCNNKDVWVVTHDWNSNAFRTYLVTSAGVNPVPVISNVGQVIGGSTFNAIGCIKASPDGRKLASASDNPQSFELFDFDLSTGMVSNQIMLSIPGAAGSNGAFGVEFSPDGTKLYAGTLSPNIYQYNLCAGSSSAIANSGVLIGTSPSPPTTNLGALQLGPDGKIYISRAVVPWVGVINNPNTLGVGCNFVDNGVSLAGKNAYLGLPNYINDHFRQPPPPFSMSDTCLTGNFSAPAIATTCVSTPITSLSWNFGDPASGANNTSTVNNPTHIFTAAGTYTVTLVFNYPCSSDTLQQTITVVNCGFNATANPTNILCNSQCTGAATANSSGGVGPYTYAWSNSQSTQVITGLCPGIYTVTVTDSTSASVTATVSITQPAVLTASVSSTATGCGLNNGTASVNGGGGTPGYTYNWSVSPVQTTQTATGLAAGNYTATVTDANGCSQTQTVTVASSGTFSVSAVSTQAGCTVNNGSATALANGGSSPYTYTWNNGQLTQTATGLAPGNYTVTITDASGCTGTQTVNVNSAGSVSVAVSSTQTGCNLNNGTASATGSNGTIPYSYSWNNGQSTQTATGLGTGTYSVVVTDANGCSQGQVVSVTQTTGPSATASASPGVIALGDSTLLSSTGGGTYMWSPATGLSCTTCPNPVATPGSTMMYCVTVTDANNCTDTECATVTVFIEPIDCSGMGELYLPNAFSPNADGENDVLKLYYGNFSCIETFKLTIYNRWGENVFETSDPVFAWDGKYDNGILNSGVYAYFMNVTFVTGKKTNKNGNINLTR